MTEINEAAETTATTDLGGSALTHLLAVLLSKWRLRMKGFDSLQVGLHGDDDGTYSHGQMLMLDDCIEDLENAIANTPSQFFTASEINGMRDDPDVLRALAEWHEIQGTMADAIEPGYYEPHARRKAELLSRASKIEEDYDA